MFIDNYFKIRSIVHSNWINNLIIFSKLSSLQAKNSKLMEEEIINT